MVANLSSHKRGWDDRWEEFSAAAEEGQQLKDALLRAVDEDTDAFNAIMTAFGLPKGTPEEKTHRKAAIEAATRKATEVPAQVMRLAAGMFPLVRQMVEQGNPNSVTDAGVGALCARAAVHGAYLNVKINASGLENRAFAEQVLEEGAALVALADREEREIIALVQAKIAG